MVSGSLPIICTISFKSSFYSLWLRTLHPEKKDIVYPLLAVCVANRKTIMTFFGELGSLDRTRGFP